MEIKEWYAYSSKFSCYSNEVIKLTEKVVIYVAYDWRVTRIYSEDMETFIERIDTSKEPEEIDIEESIDDIDHHI